MVMTDNSSALEWQCNELRVKWDISFPSFFRECDIPKEVLSNSVNILCLALGSPSSLRVAKTQLQYLVYLIQRIPRPIPPCVVCEPKLSPADQEILNGLGINYTTDAPFISDTAGDHASFSIKKYLNQDKINFIFAPHCPRIIALQALDSILYSSYKIIWFGNDFKIYRRPNDQGGWTTNHGRPNDQAADEDLDSLYSHGCGSLGEDDAFSNLVWYYSHSIVAGGLSVMS